jgi:hypothetical protein
METTKYEEGGKPSHRLSTLHTLLEVPRITTLGAALPGLFGLRSCCFPLLIPARVV